MQIYDCVGVCPVDCFTRARTCWSSHPDESSTAASANECPADAIKPDTSPAWKWLEVNTDAQELPNITPEDMPRTKEFEGGRKVREIFFKGTRQRRLAVDKQGSLSLFSAPN
jgi:ferredoxin